MTTEKSTENRGPGRPMIGAKRQTIVTFGIDEKLLLRLERVANRQGKSRSSMLREIVTQYLSGQPGSKA